jgi:hypothetical protein
MQKGGASQTHPHLQATMNDLKYYEQFEIIRNGAENYFRATNRNYFSDVLKLHETLGLTFRHGNAIAVIPLVRVVLKLYRLKFRH